MVKDTVNVPEIIEKMKLAQVVLDEKGLIDFTQNLVFFNKNLYAGNDKMAIICPIAVNLDFSVNGADFYKALEGVSKEATLSLKEQTLKINSDRVKAKLSVWDSAASLEWIESTGLNNIRNWKELPEEFWPAVSWCKFSVSKDISIRVLTCLCIKGNQVYSTDSFRVSRYIMSAKMPDLLIPKENIDILLKFPAMKEYAIVIKDDIPTWLCFRENETGLICGTRLVVGSFPDLDAHFETEPVATLSLPDDLKTQVSRAGKFVDSTIDEAVLATVKVGGKKVKIMAQKATGTLEQISDLDYEGKPFIFHIIPSLFEQILDKTTTVLLCEKNLRFNVGNFSHILSIRQGEEDFEED